MRRDDDILRPLLPDPTVCGTVLDCAAGIGSQAIALAQRGYAVEGLDSSEASVKRAKHYAAQLGLEIPFRVDDLPALTTAPENYYGAVLAMDNIFPHLGSEEAMRTAAQAIFRRLRPDGVLIAGLRDYDPILQSRPTVIPPSFAGNGHRRIFHEVWDWHDNRRYTCHVYVTKEVRQHWEVMHFTGNYCAILKCELAQLLQDCGFTNVWIMPTEVTGFHHALIRGEKPAV